MRIWALVGIFVVALVFALVIVRGASPHRIPDPTPTPTPFQSQQLPLPPAYNG